MHVVTKRASAGGKEAEKLEEQEKVSCWRWLLVILAMPFLALFTVVGLVVWVVLLPLKIICCPIGRLTSCDHTRNMQKFLPKLYI